MVGTLVEFSLELKLALSGIRQEQGTWNIGLMILNSLIEFNLGIILMYLLWVTIKLKRYHKYYLQLSYKDLKYVKTNFDFIAFICNSGTINEKQMKTYYRLYAIEDFFSDITYYCEKYNKKPINERLLTEINRYWE